MFRQKFGKYRSIRQECLSEHWHHSKFEAGKCDELRLLKKGGVIRDFVTQKRVYLYLGNVYMGSQTVDFYIEHNDGSFEFLETKGSHLVNESKWKRDWKIMQEMYKENRDIKFTVEICR